MILAAALIMCSPVDPDTIRCPDYDLVRIAGIDGPELWRAKCPAERRLAELGTLYVFAFTAEPVQIVPAGPRERYGRILAHVRRDGRDLGAELKAAGLARRWEGRRTTWCN